MASETPPIADPFALKIQMHSYLPAGTILVSPDIWELLREQYSEEGRDRAFMRALGIIPDPPREKFE